MFRHGSASKGAIRTRNRDNMNEHGARERVSYAEMTIVNVQETLRAKRKKKKKKKRKEKKNDTCTERKIEKVQRTIAKRVAKREEKTNRASTDFEDKDASENKT